VQNKQADQITYITTADVGYTYCTIHGPLHWNSQCL